MPLLLAWQIKNSSTVPARSNLRTMTDWHCLPGNTLLIPSGPSGHHLFILVLGPSVFPDYGANTQVIHVGITTVYDGTPYDDACVLEAGEHPFIQHRSYVAYRHARLDTAAHVATMVESGAWIPREALSPALLEKILAGARNSRQMSREYKRFFA